LGIWLLLTRLLRPLLDGEGFEYAIHERVADGDGTGHTQVPPIGLRVSTFKFPCCCLPLWMNDDLLLAGLRVDPSLATRCPFDHSEPTLDGFPFCFL